MRYLNTCELAHSGWGGAKYAQVFLKSAFDELGTAAMRGIENYFAHGDKAATAAVAGDSAKATPAATEPQAVAVSE